MARIMRTIKTIRTPIKRQRVKNMIKDLEIMNLEAHVKDDDFDGLVVVYKKLFGKGLVEKY